MESSSASKVNCKMKSGERGGGGKVREKKIKNRRVYRLLGFQGRRVRFRCCFNDRTKFTPLIFRIPFMV